MTTRTIEAATIVAQLVPGCVDNAGHFALLTKQQYDRLSTGERAAYEIAIDLYNGGGSLAKYVAFADQRYAGVLIAALQVALGDRLVPCVFEAS